MTLDEFNDVSRELAASELTPCLDIPRWIDAIVARRPYASREALLEVARTVAKAFTPAEIEHALSRHPRIGERPAGGGTDARMSADEQAGLRDASPELEQALARGNAEYERKFGRIFLIRAAGRSRPEVLAQLHVRITHTEAEELVTIAEQLGEIAVLRLQGVIHA